MNNLESKILHRINELKNLNSLDDIINRLSVYGITFYNNKGNFKLNQFKDDCIKITNILLKNDKSHPETGIRYQLCDFLSIVQTIVGIRNFNQFIYDDSLITRIKREEELWGKI